MMNKKAIVIGSGFGGIASALRLNKLGFKVTLLERLDTLGGRLAFFKKKDIGTMPDQPL
jgi:phytoene dehydrogenase-like protein